MGETEVDSTVHPPGIATLLISAVVGSPQLCVCGGRVHICHFCYARLVASKILEHGRQPGCVLRLLFFSSFKLVGGGYRCIGVRVVRILVLEVVDMMGITSMVVLCEPEITTRSFYGPTQMGSLVVPTISVCVYIVRRTCNERFKWGP